MTKVPKLLDIHPQTHTPPPFCFVGIPLPHSPAACCLCVWKPLLLRSHRRNRSSQSGQGCKPAAKQPDSRRNSKAVRSKVSMDTNSRRRENVAPGATPGPGANSIRGAFRCACPALVVLPFPPGRPGGGSSAVRRPASLPPGAGCRASGRPNLRGAPLRGPGRRPLLGRRPVLNPGGPVAPCRAAGGPGLALRAPCGALAAAVSAAAARLPLWAWRWLLPGFPPPSPGGFGASGPPGVWGSGGRGGPPPGARCSFGPVPRLAPCSAASPPPLCSASARSVSEGTR